MASTLMRRSLSPGLSRLTVSRVMHPKSRGGRTKGGRRPSQEQGSVHPRLRRWRRELASWIQGVRRVEVEGSVRRSSERGRGRREPSRDEALAESLLTLCLRTPSSPYFADSWCKQVEGLYSGGDRIRTKRLYWRQSRIAGRRSSPVSSSGKRLFMSTVRVCSNKLEGGREHKYTTSTLRRDAGPSRGSLPLLGASSLASTCERRVKVSSCEQKERRAG